MRDDVADKAEKIRCIEAVMLSGQPFNSGDLSVVFSGGKSTCDRDVDRTIQRLRKAGKITGKRTGRTFIWKSE